jgi:nucleotide-binding universal stress UspA family protein
MSNAPTIVCAVDFSDHSKVALDWACAWARHFGARLMVVTVVEPLLVNAAAATYDMDLVREEVLPELRQFVGTTDAAVRARRMSPEYVVLVGEPAAEIVALAQRERAQLIVMATHGLSGYRKMLVGSTTEKVLRQVTVPVLIAPPSDQGLPTPHSLTTGFGHVLVPVDFKDESSRDLRAGAVIARTLGVRLVILRVVAPIKGLERLRPDIDVHNRAQFEVAEREVQRLTSKIRESIDIESVIAIGSPAEEIAKTAVGRGVGLIVMGLRRQEHFLGAARVDRLSRAGTGTGADPCPSTRGRRGRVDEARSHWSRAYRFGVVSVAHGSDL